MTAVSLRERKQRQAREKIVRAAYDLFAEKGFDAVTVADIAERAEVGRTTFFRYFGDKQEVVFADEQRHADRLAAVVSTLDGTVDGLPGALRLVRTVVLALSGDVVADPGRYAAHHTLVTRHPELRDRSHRKLDRLTGDLRDLLRDRGADPETAVLAARIGIACFQAAQETADDDATILPAALARAFDAVQRV